MPFVESDDPNEITLDVLTASGQVVNALRIRDRDGNVLLALDKDGKMEVLGGIELAGLFLLTGNIGLTGNLTQTGNTTITGNLDITGEFYAKGAMPPADYVVMPDDATYKAFSCRTGDLLTSSATYATVYAAALAALTSGTGVIIDMTNGMGPGPTVNRYRDGVHYDPDLMVEPLDIKPSQVLSVFDGGAEVEWISQGGNTASDDTTFVTRGTKSIKLSDALATGAGVFMYKTMAASFDIRENSLFLRFKRNRGQYESNAGDMQILVSKDNSGYDLYSCYVSIPSVYAYEYEVTIPFEQLGAVGYPNPADMNTVKIVIHASVGYPLTVICDELSLYKPVNDKAIFMFSVDDWTVGIEDKMKPVMDQYGFRGCFNVATLKTIFDVPTDDYGIQDVEEIRMLKESGWDIASHSHAHLYMPAVADHPNPLGQVTAQTVNQYISDVIVSLRYMRHFGLTGKWHIFGTPYGDWSYEIMEILKDYFHMTWATYMGKMQFPNGRHHSMMRSVFDDKSLAQAQTEVTTGIANKAIVTALWHTIDGDAFSLADFTTFCAWLATQDIDVMTPSELLSRYYPSQPTMYLMQSELFHDVLAADTDHCHAAEAGIDASKEVTTALTNPDVPRNVSITVTNNDTPYGSIYVVGTDARGRPSREKLLVSGGATTYGNIPFATVTMYVIHAGISTLDTVSLGISDKLGLSNPVEADTDVRKVKVNTADATVGTVDKYNGTVNCATINANDDITIWYKTPVTMRK